ncbi:MAG: exo-alpha-sialidase, partial [Sphingobacteriaceae bacterium]
MKHTSLAFFLFLITVSLVLVINLGYSQERIRPYNWKSVQIAGGGFVDGIIFHPTTKGLLYCRTDMGGAYRWNDALKAWEPLLDWVSYKDNNLMGVESIALDAADPDRLYMACGTYTSSPGPNAILRSDDKGKTFKRTDVRFRMGGNENGRGNGERMAVDPNNGNLIYMGTR